MTTLLAIRPEEKDIGVVQDQRRAKITEVLAAPQKNKTINQLTISISRTTVSNEG